VQVGIQCNLNDLCKSNVHTIHAHIVLTISVEHTGTKAKKLVRDSSLPTILLYSIPKIVTKRSTMMNLQLVTMKMGQRVQGHKSHVHGKSLKTIQSQNSGPSMVLRGKTSMRMFGVLHQHRQMRILDVYNKIPVSRMAMVLKAHVFEAQDAL
jgi:hypothetical protein